MQTDILNLEFPNLDRDRHLITPVYLYLRKRYGYRVVSKNLQNRFYCLLRYRPRLLLLSNAHGQEETIEIMKVAQAAGIKVATLVTEGNFHEENLNGYLWGWNREKRLFQDALILWNDKSHRMSLRQHPELEGKLFVSGATGFDRYSLFSFVSKKNFLERFGLQRYLGIVGIAGFGIFDHVNDFEYMREMSPSCTREQFEMHREDLGKLRSIYRELIASNPDLLFVLRFHPQIRDRTKSEFTEVIHLPNVILSDNYEKNPYELNNVTDVISISDLWLGYESTTVIEAWLLKKPVILINPTRFDFVRENHHQGCVKVSTVSQAQRLIDEYYHSKAIREFDELENSRNEILASILGHTDGRNHQRAAEIIHSLGVQAKWPSRWRILCALPLRYAIRNTLRYLLYPTGLYRKVRPNVWASHFWYPLRSDEVEWYEALYDPVIGEE